MGGSDWQEHLLGQTGMELLSIFDILEGLAGFVSGRLRGSVNGLVFRAATNDWARALSQQALARPVDAVIARRRLCSANCRWCRGRFNEDVPGLARVQVVVPRSAPVAPETDGLTGPEYLTVATAEVARDMCEGLLALAVVTGLQVVSAMMAAGVTTLAGVKGKHDSDWVAVRHGRECGSVTLGGRRAAVE